MSNSNIHETTPFPQFYLSPLTITVSAQDTAPQQLAPLVVTGKAEDLIGIANTASEGEVNAEELSEHPYLRRGELLEVVPGVIITQHSGRGEVQLFQHAPARDRDPWRGPARLFPRLARRFHRLASRAAG